MCSNNGDDIKILKIRAEINFWWINSINFLMFSCRYSLSIYAPKDVFNKIVLFAVLLMNKNMLNWQVSRYCYELILIEVWCLSITLFVVVPFDSLTTFSNEHCWQLGVVFVGMWSKYFITNSNIWPLAMFRCFHQLLQIKKGNFRVQKVFVQEKKQTFINNIKLVF